MTYHNLLRSTVFHSNQRQEIFLGCDGKVATHWKFPPFYQDSTSRCKRKPCKRVEHIFPQVSCLKLVGAPEVDISGGRATQSCNINSKSPFRYGSASVGGFRSSRCRWQSRMRTRTSADLERVSELEESEPLITEAKPIMPSTPGCLFQAFGWNSHLKTDGRTFYERMTDLAPELKATGFTHVLFPPCTRAADPQGFMPEDFYNLDSAYGTEAQLKAVLAILHKYGMYVILDVVLHQFVGSEPACQAAWNKAGTILDSEIDLGNWIGKGDFESDDEIPENGAISLTERNLMDHSHPVFQNDVKGWLLWLKKDVGFDGWCFDYAKTYDPKIFQIYGEETTPAIAVGDVWHPMRYNGSMLEYNQDEHRQQLCDWVNVSGGTARVFDYTTKGILQRAVEATEYWRLCDPQGKPTGLIGWWPEMAVTFLDNHSTGSEPKLWPYPMWGIELGYVYILTHPGTPCIFAEDFQDPSLQAHIRSLLAIRRKWNICPDSQIHIVKCDADLYVAKIGRDLDSADFKGVYVKFGPSFNLRGFVPPPDFDVAISGHDYCVWERVMST